MTGAMGEKAIYVENEIKADVERVCQSTQNPALYPRRDLARRATEA